VPRDTVEVSAEPDVSTGPAPAADPPGTAAPGHAAPGTAAPGHAASAHAAPSPAAPGHAASAHAAPSPAAPGHAASAQAAPSHAAPAHAGPATGSTAPPELPARRGRLAPWDVHGPLPHLLLGLTVLTGVVDAVSYIALGHVFVANMTGNVVLLGFALAGAPGLSIPASLVALGMFLVGAALGGALGRRLSHHRGVLLRTSTTAVATALLVALVVAAAAGTPIADGPRYALIAVLAVPMGAQAAVARRIAVPDLTTAVLTMTLTGLAAESRLLGGPGSTSGRGDTDLRRVGAVVAMGTGALVGGLLVVDVSPASALALALAVAVVVGLAAHRIATRPGEPWAAGR
jgi:uncharacterized membrane protein YoaK (UPF0700 family)